MKRRAQWASIGVAMATATVLSAAAWGRGRSTTVPTAQGRAAAGQTGTTVLGEGSSWRMFHVMRPPVVRTGDGKTQAHAPAQGWLAVGTPPADANWRDPGFDDSAWLRSTARGGCRAPFTARQCARARFEVTDPQKVLGLAISVEYCGGLAVYLNGREIARRHLPQGPLTDSTLAEAYPHEAFVTAEGDLLAASGTYTGLHQRAGPPDAESLRRMALRRRSLDELPIPPSALRKGVNVLAVEVVRSPYDSVMLEDETQSGGRRRYNKYDWPTCDLLDVRLAAAGAEGLVPNVSRPEGLQVWNADPMAGDTTLDWGDRCEVLRPVSIVSPRNGLFTGKVGVGCDKAIEGLRAVAGDLKGDHGAVIPASAIRFRYGLPWGSEAGLGRRDGGSLLGILAEAPPP